MKYIWINPKQIFRGHVYICLFYLLHFTYKLFTTEVEQRVVQLWLLISFFPAATSSEERERESYIEFYEYTDPKSTSISKSLIATQVEIYYNWGTIISRSRLVITLTQNSTLPTPIKGTYKTTNILLISRSNLGRYSGQFEGRQAVSSDYKG